jgi:ABC-2 type transport system permease protein
MTGALPEIIRQSSWGQEFLHRYSGSPDASIGDIFLEMISISMGMTAAFYTALSLLQLRSEEIAGHAELLLATPASRAAWVASHLVFALLGTLAILAAGGAALGIVYGVTNGNLADALSRTLLGVLLEAPAAWVLGGLAMFVFGTLPRFAGAITWAALIYVQLIGEVLGPIILGSTYRFQLANALQPFHWVPKITSGAPFTPLPILVLVCLAGGLIATGIVAFRRRDVSV